jgi:YhcH/YjgK/YiaL family protein
MLYNLVIPNKGDVWRLRNIIAERGISMITQNIKNAYLYYGLGERLAKGLKYLEQTDFSGMAPGKYEIDGSDVFALVQKYDSKPISQGKWEAHRKYIDIQFIVKGVEQIGYANLDSLEVIQEYDAERDCLLLQGKGNMFECNSGTFAIFDPQDAHMPCIAVRDPEPVKKVVVKVRV